MLLRACAGRVAELVRADKLKLHGVRHFVLDEVRTLQELSAFHSSCFMQPGRAGCSSWCFTAQPVCACPARRGHPECPVGMTYSSHHCHKAVQCTQTLG